MDTQDKQIASEGNGLSEDELIAVKKIFAGLLLTNKNLSLYPHGHTICMNSMKQFYTLLATFLQKGKNLKFDIERDRILSRGEVISSGLPEEGTMHFSLFRDGIRWLEFKDGIEQREINEVLLIINRYTKLASEPEGDIVTAFWEARFPHVEYEVAEFSWGGDMETSCGASDIISGKADGMQLREKDLGRQEPLSDPVIDQASLMISQQEKITLQEMIKREEDADPTFYLDALLDSLLQHREKENFNLILEVLFEEFTASLKNRDFTVPLKILQGLQYVFEICESDMPWTGPSIKDFLMNASGNEALSPLKEIWKDIDPADAVVLGETFKLLKPNAIHTFVSLLQQPQKPPLRQMLLDSIIFLASQDMGPLESVLNSAEEKLIERIFPVIVNMDGKQSLRYLMKLAHHNSAHVRHEAVKGIIKRDPDRLKDIFSLIDDKDDSIRRLLLKQMGQSRDPAIEELLLSYLKKMKSGKGNSGHVISCFSALGKTGSSRSVPFLRETLLRWGWMPGSGRSFQRRGAAMALLALEISEADQVLRRAARSLYPGLRGLVKKVMLESQQGGAR